MDYQLGPGSHLIHVWNVAFSESNVHGWWDLFSPPWCRHVRAFGYAAAVDAWVVIDPAEKRTTVLVIPDNEFGEWLSQLDEERPVILRCEGKDTRPQKHRLGEWCSTMVARLCGVRGGAWRPLALYRSLLAEGAEAVFGTVPYGHQDKTGSGRPGDEAPASAG